MTELVPDKTENGLRADAWLAAHWPHVPKSSIRKLLDAGALALLPSGRKISKGDRIVANAVYMLKQVPEPGRLKPNRDVLFSLLSDDNGILALSKPAGTDCQPNAISETETLANGLLARWPELEGVGDGPLTCGILHRIDRDTSGLVLAALTQENYAAVRRQFSEHTVVKHYLALVQGHLLASGTLINELAHNPRCPGRMIDAEKWNGIRRPMHAETHYVPLQHYWFDTHSFTLVDVTIRTGVTHQIRAQFSFAGMPLLGDKRYGGLQIPDFARHFLHSASAELIHPHTGQAIRYEAPLTEDLKNVLKRMRTVSG